MAAARGGARSVAAVPDKPSPVSFNMDALEREDAQAQPFVVVLDGSRYEFNDIQDVEFGAIVRAGTDALKLLHLIVRSDDHKAFFAVVDKAPAWKVRDLTQSYMNHYGMVNPGEAPGSRA